MKVWRVTVEINNGMHEVMREFASPIETEPSMGPVEIVNAAMDSVLAHLRARPAAPEPRAVPCEAGQATQGGLAPEGGQDFGWQEQAGGGK